jgi:hypothetical protein
LHKSLLQYGALDTAAAFVTAVIHALIFNFDLAMFYDADYIALNVVLQFALFSELLYGMTSPRFLDRDVKKFY